MPEKRGKADQLISSIYDAALDGRIWTDALTDLAGSVGCQLATLEIHNSGKGPIRGHNPLMAPEFRETFHDYWRHSFSLRALTAGQPAGRVLSLDAIADGDGVRRSAFYNEWVRPQGIGGDSRFAKVFIGGETTAILTAWRPLRNPVFDDDEHRLFELAVPHFIRALDIHFRLRLAHARETAVMAGAAPAGFLIVDQQGRILASHEPTQRRLEAAGLLSPNGELGALETGLPDLRRIVEAACSGRTAGSFEHRAADGALLRLRAMPISEELGGRTGAAWLPLSDPAALVFVAAPEDDARERVTRLAALHGLTPAEASVAIEAAKGDGRAAVAARLGIRETTVRSHLSAIFDKLGIHRQAELSRIVAAE